MSQSTLFRLGAFATLLVALGFTAGELVYFLGAAHTILFSWVFFIVGFLEVFAITALYAAQSHRGGVFALLGFVLLITCFVVANMNQMGDLAADAGIITRAQLEQGPQIGLLVVLGVVEQWTWPLGLLLFGIGTLRAGVYSRWCGVLLILLGVISVIRDFWILEYLFAAIALVVFGWLGLSLWKKAGVMAA